MELVTSQKKINLRLVTWNVWGVPIGTPHRRQRIKEIAAGVAKTKADIACFQEVFLERDRRMLCDLLAKAGMRYYCYFPSPPAGSGLLTVSRHPLREAIFHRFSQGGNPLAFNHGDWWAGKGVGFVTVRISEFGQIRVANTHLHARYRGDRYRSLRQSQVKELMKVIETAASEGDPVFLLGDLNYGKDDFFWKDILEKHQLQQLSKSWSSIDYIFGVTSPSFRFNNTPGAKLAGQLSDGKTPLSDHSGIVTDVELTRR